MRERPDDDEIYVCVTCRDSGTRSFMCGDGADDRRRYPWLMAAPCGRTHQAGYVHEWAEVCACAPTNPVIGARVARAMGRYQDGPTTRERAARSR